MNHMGINGEGVDVRRSPALWMLIDEAADGRISSFEDWIFF